LGGFLRASVILPVLAGACVAHHPYPEHWATPAAPASDDCRPVAGTYRDRGEMPGSSAQPSLTNELLGYHSGWGAATEVSLAFSTSDAMQIVVSGAGGELSRHTFVAESGEFACDGGRAVVRLRRRIAANVVIGRQSIVYELEGSEDHLVVRYQERALVLMFLLPIPGTTSGWYRFQRLSDGL
jgi:hypothetical protein